MTTTTKNKTSVAITGNTYPVKEQLKALGARWNGDIKAWMVAPDKAAAAQALVDQAPAPARSIGRRSTGRMGFSRRDRYDRDDSCELCGRNRYTCGHCIGW